MDSPAGLPGRPLLLENLSTMIDAGECPGVFIISIDGFSELPGAEMDAGSSPMNELAARLGRLVRANDVLAVLAPGVFALASAGVEQVDAEVVLDRIRGVFAMPVEFQGELVSLPVTVGVSHHTNGASADDLVALAEHDLQNQLSG